MIPHQPNEELNMKNQTNNNKKKNPLQNLMAGDVVWYINHNLHHHSRWLKAIFLKRFSKNTFQVETGNVRVMAHRSQLRHAKQNEMPRPNVTVTALGDNNEVMSEEVPFLGFPEKTMRRTVNENSKYHPSKQMLCQGVRNENE